MRQVLQGGRSVRSARLASLWGALALLAAGLWPASAQAVPLFNRQTGQNCVACHAGGQFPELTPYGRMFKMTGYTIGERTVPVSVMALASVSRVADTAKSDDPAADFSKNGSLILPTASLFLGGKISDNFGAFTQITYDNYASQSADGAYHGHSGADNIDLRYADRFIDEQRDLVVGVSLNNNPSVSDPWNTAAAWMQYVPVPSPSSSQFIDGNAPYPGYGSGGGVAGLTAYAYLNRQWYAELGAYRTANGVFRLLSAGSDPTALEGLSPYWRLAYTREWGAHNLMVGLAGMDAKLSNADTGPDRYRDWLLDAQYQYLLDPNVVTAQFSYSTRSHHYGATPSALGFVDAQGHALADPVDTDTTHVLRAKLSYVYQARYGGSIGVFNLSGSTNVANQSSGFDPATLSITNTDPAASVLSTRVGGNLSGNPGTRGATLEAFWTPVQYLRIGAQYTLYTRFNGAASNYDGLGRNAHDNNSLFLYAWAAY